MADARADIDVNIDVSSALANLKALQKEISSFQTAMMKGNAAQANIARQQQQALIDSINSTGKFSARMMTVASSTENFTKALESNKLSMGEYFRYGAASTKTFGKFFRKEFETISEVAASRVRTLQTQYIKLGRDANGALKSISVRPLALDMDNLATKTAIAAQRQQLLNKLLDQGSTNLLNFGKNTQWAGRQLMVGFTIPLSIFGVTAAKTFMEMEKQALRFKRVYGELFTTPQQTDEMLVTVRELASEFTKYGIALEKTVSLAADVAAMGVAGTDLVKQVAEISRLSILGGVEQEQALETVTSLTNAFGIATVDLANKTNFLNAVENQTITSIEDLTVAIPKAGPVIQQLGGDVEDLAFFLTAMREGGINASEGANALKSGLASLINPTEKASKFMESLGINVKQIVEGNKGDVKRTVIEFAQALDQLDPLNRARAIEQLFGKFQFARLSTLFQNVIKDGSQAERVLQLTNANAEELAILAERELKRVEDSPMYKFQKAVEDLKGELIPLGEAFLELATPIIEFGKDVLENFNKMSEGSKTFILGLIAVLGGIAPVALMTFGLVANGVANLVKFFGFLGRVYTKSGSQSQILGQQTEYMTQQQLEAAAVASSLNQTHGALTQTFSVEAKAVRQLGDAYRSTIAAQARFGGPGIPSTLGGRKKYKKGVVSVPGPKGAGDVVPAMLAPGEAVIPAKMSEKFAPLINAMITDTVPGYKDGRISQRLQPYSQGHVAGFEIRTLPQTVRELEVLFRSLAGATDSQSVALRELVRETLNTKIDIIEFGNKVDDVNTGIVKSGKKISDIGNQRNTGAMFGAAGGTAMTTNARNLALNSVGAQEPLTFKQLQQAANIAQQRINAGAVTTQEYQLELEALIQESKQYKTVQDKAQYALSNLKSRIESQILTIKPSIKAEQLKTQTEQQYNKVLQSLVSTGAITMDAQKRNIVAINENTMAAVLAAEEMKRAAIAPAAVTRGNADVQASRGVQRGFRKGQNQNTRTKVIRGDYSGPLTLGASTTRQATSKRMTGRIAGVVSPDAITRLELETRQGISTFFNKALAAIRKGLKIESPSKEFQEIANEVERGAEKAKPKAKKAGEGLGQAIAEGAQSKKKYAKGTVGQIQMQQQSQAALYPGLTNITSQDKSLRRQQQKLDRQNQKVLKAQEVIAARKQAGVRQSYGTNTFTPEMRWQRKLEESKQRQAVAAEARARQEQMLAQQAAAEKRKSNIALRLLDRITAARKKRLAEEQAAGGATRGNRARKFAGGGMAASGVLMAASMVPGQVGETASQLMMPIMALSMILPMLTTPLGAITVGVGALAAGLIYTHLQLEKTRLEAMKLADTMSSGKEAMSQFAEAAGTVTPSEYMEKRRENKISPYVVQSGKVTFGQSFVESEDGKQMLENFEKQVEEFGSSKAIGSLKKKLSMAVATGVLSKEQANSVATSVGQKLKDFNITAQINAAIGEITGPDGNVLEGNTIKIYLDFIQSSSIGLTGAGGLLSSEDLTGGAPIFWWDSENVAEVEGQAASAIKSFFDENQQLIDSLDAQYLPEIDELKAKGKYDEALAKEKEYLEKRSDLVGAYNNEVLSLVDDFYNVRDSSQDAILRSMIDSAKQLDPKVGENADKFRTSLAPQKVVIIAQLATGNLGADTFNKLMSMFDANTQEGSASWNLLANISTSVGPGALDQLENIFTVMNNPNKAAEFLVQIESKDSAEAQKIIDTVEQISTFDGKTIEADLVVQHYVDNPEDLEQLMNNIEVLNKLKDEGNLNIDSMIEAKVLTDPAQIEAFKKDSAYFNSLSPEQQVRYVTIYQTKFEATAENEIAAWRKANPWAADLSDDWVKNRIVTEESKQYMEDNPTGDATETGGEETPTGGGTKQDPYEGILKQLKEVRKASINAAGGFSELNKQIGKNKLGDVFDGVKSQLIKTAGSSGAFTDWLLGLDADVQKQFMKVEKGVVKLTNKGKQMMKAFNEVALGNIFVGFEQSIQQTKNQNAAVKKLVEAGVDAADAYEIVSDEAAAAALASKQLSTKELEKIVELQKESNQQGFLQGMKKDILEFNKTIKEEAAALPELMAAGFSDIQIAAIFSDENLRGWALAAIEEGRNLAEEFGTVFNERLEQVINSPEFLKKVAEDAFSVINDAFARQEALLQAQFAAATAADQAIILEAEDQIAKINYQIDDYEAELHQIELQEEAINKSYDQRIKALDKISQLNAYTTEQDKAKLSVADALTRGDIASAAAAVQEYQAKAAEEALNQQKQALEYAREAELAALTSANGNTRAVLEQRIKDLKEKIFEIEEKTLEPAQERIRLAEVQLKRELASLVVNGLTKLQWQLINAGIDMAIGSTEDFVTELGKAVKKATDLATKLQAAAFYANQANGGTGALPTFTAKPINVPAGGLISQEDVAGAIDEVVGLIDGFDLSALTGTELFDTENVFGKMFGESEMPMTFEDTVELVETMRQKWVEIKTTISNISSSVENNLIPNTRLAKDEVLLLDEAVLGLDATAKFMTDSLKASFESLKAMGYDYIIGVLTTMNESLGQANSLITQIKEAWSSIKDKTVNITIIKTILYRDEAGNAIATPAEDVTTQSNGGLIGTYNMGGMVKRYNMGGMIKRLRSGGFAMGTDIVPAALTPGEFVMRKYAVQNFGADRLKAINSGTYKGDSVYNYSVTLNVASQSNPDEIANRVMTQIRRVDSQRLRSNSF